MNEEGFVSLVETQADADNGANASCVCIDCISCDCANDCDQ